MILYLEKCINYYYYLKIFIHAKKKTSVKSFSKHFFKLIILFNNANVYDVKKQFK